MMHILVQSPPLGVWVRPVNMLTYHSSTEIYKCGFSLSGFEALKMGAGAGSRGQGIQVPSMIYLTATTSQKPVRKWDLRPQLLRNWFCQQLSEFASRFFPAVSRKEHKSADSSFSPIRL